MRAPRTLVLYVSREIVQYGALAFLGITTILVSQHLLRRLDDLVVVGFSARDLWQVVMCLVPMLTVYATPIAFLFGVSLAVSRLASDSEVLAMRAAGIGLRPLLAGPLLVALAVSLATAWLMWRVEPAAQRELRTMFKTVAARGGLLEAGKFRDVLGRVIFVESRDHENRLRGVVIEDRSDAQHPFLIFAEHGRFVFDAADAEIRFELRDGDLHLEPDPGDPDQYSRIEFQRLSYGLDVSSLVSGRSAQLRPREMSYAELRENLALLRSGGPKPEFLREAEPVEYELQLHRRVALPFAPLLFALMAVPLGLRRSGTSRSWGALIALGIVFAYYSLMSFGEYLAREDWIPAMAALWVPNVAIGGFAGWLAVRARRDLGR